MLHALTCLRVKVPGFGFEFRALGFTVCGDPTLVAKQRNQADYECECSP